MSEFILFLVPFAAFLVWRRTAAAGGPSAGVLVVALGSLLLLGAALAWMAVNHSLGRAQRYVPARLEQGQVIPGHAAP